MTTTTTLNYTYAVLIPTKTSEGFKENSFLQNQLVTLLAENDITL